MHAGRGFYLLYEGCVNYQAARRFRTFLPRGFTRPDRLCPLRTAAAATRRFGLLADSENRASASITLSVAVRSVSASSFAKPSAVPRNVAVQTRTGSVEKANHVIKGLYISGLYISEDLRSGVGSCAPGKSRPTRRAASFREFKSFLLVALFHCIFDITRHVMRGAFSLVELTFSLQFFIARGLSSSVLDSTLHFFGRAFDVFAIHTELFLLCVL
jgi:hypothetical protein